MDIHPFGEHDKRDTQPDETGETIPFIPTGVIEGGCTWEPEQETSFRGTSQKMKVLKEHIENLGQTPEAIHFNNFELRDKRAVLQRQEQILDN